MFVCLLLIFFVNGLVSEQWTWPFFSCCKVFTHVHRNSIASTLESHSYYEHGVVKFTADF